MKPILLAASLLVAAPAWAQAPAVTVTDAWARATAASQKIGGAFVTIHDSAAPDRLVSASSPVADKVEVHETVDTNGVMSMRPVPVLPLAAGQTVQFKPGGYHLMLIGLKHKLDVGSSFPLTLTFDKAPPVTVTVTVGRAGASGPAMEHGGMSMPMPTPK